MAKATAPMQPKAVFKAILFDLGGTLVRALEPSEIFRRILLSHGLNISQEALTEAHKRQFEKFDNDKLALMGRDYWVRWNMHILREVGVHSNINTLAKRIDQEWFDNAELEVYPDVPATLSQLKKRGVKTGIVTNGLKSDYRLVLNKVKLQGFDVVVGIDDCGHAKPRKEIFLHALNKLEVKPEEAIFIGDSVKFDYKGASKAGLKPLLICRNGNPPDGIETIRDLTEVLKHAHQKLNER